MASGQIVLTKDAPAAVGPYSQAIKTPTAIYCSGALPLTPDGILVNTSISAQTEQSCENLSAILKEAGSSMCNVVKCVVFLSDMGHFAKMNKVYAKYFPHNPARSCVAVKTLPKDADVEIECIALP
ncbi:endoribonuclease L-PSP [Fusarium oxysporum NRRL 32931]|uniref:Endoribonuclease L-PSP n=1 Tax=Fusarium oxysporum NRRL 32931 TaxID=660029 RepID=W9HNY9_FUSOX|nr:endoribonuclease L-PSP [Fusarium oxysporum NRRL 32931]